MITIKAMKKDKEGKLYCDPLREKGGKFYYEVGETYTIPVNKVRMCRRGFHASANCDIGETLPYYDIEDDTAYCLVDINVVSKKEGKVVGDYIKILKEITDLDELIKYDKTGVWSYTYAYKVGHQKKLMKAVMEKDETGELVYRYSLLSILPKEREELKRVLIKKDSTGVWSYWYARHFGYSEDIMQNIIEKDDTGSLSYFTAVLFGHNKRLMQNVIEKDNTGKWVVYYFTNIKGLTSEEKKELITDINKKFELVLYKKGGKNDKENKK